MRAAVVVALVWVWTPASRALDWRPWAYIRAPRLAIIGNEMSNEPATTRVKKVSAGLLDGRGGAAILGSWIALIDRGMTGARASRSFSPPAAFRFLSSTRRLLRLFPPGTGERGSELAL